MTEKLSETELRTKLQIALDAATDAVTAMVAARKDGFEVAQLYEDKLRRAKIHIRQVHQDLFDEEWKAAVAARFPIANGSEQKGALESDT